MTQLRDAARDAPDDADEGGTEIVPEDWPMHEVTSGRRAVVVGGDPRPRAAERIQETFGFRSVLWKENDPRRILGLADRIRGGTVDLVIALRAFMGHSDSDALRPACKEVGIPFCLVDTGYGVAQCVWPSSASASISWTTRQAKRRGRAPGPGPRTRADRPSAGVRLLSGANRQAGYGGAARVHAM